MGKNLGIEPTDVFRLVQMTCDAAAERGCSVPEVIDQLELATAGPTRPSGLFEFVRTAKRYRLRRNSSFGTLLFRDPAWDMLLDLLLAEECGKLLSVSALCLGSGVAMTTALRYVQRLIDQGFIVRHGDLLDQRRTYLELSPSRRTELLNFLGEWQRESVTCREMAQGDGTLIRGKPEVPAAAFAAIRHPVFLS